MSDEFDASELAHPSEESNNNNSGSGDAVKDEEEKKAVVLDAITSQCVNHFDDAWKDDLKKVAAALKAGATLDGEFLAGGRTNYSFRIFVAQSDADTDDNTESDHDFGDDPDAAGAASALRRGATGTPSLFCKLYLPFAIWDAGRKFDFDISRADAEFEMLTQFALADSKVSVATPHFCMDVKGDAKLLVAAWADRTDEQWANQFVEGQVDERVVTGVATALAHLNVQAPVPSSDWNDSVRRNQLSTSPALKLVYTKFTILPDDECDALMDYLKQHFGQEAFDTLVDAYCQQINQARECLNHGDCHPFNILVEPKANVLEPFGPDGTFVICDWETAVSGARGVDAGTFLAFGTACALCLSVQGLTEEAQHLVTACHETFWKAYEAVLRDAGSLDEAAVTQVYRVALGAMGAYLLFNLYMFGALADALPLDGVEPKVATQARASMGVVGLKLLQVGFDDACPQAALDLAALHEYCVSLVKEQLDTLASLSTTGAADTSDSPGARVRESMLRKLRRRVSDASSAEYGANRLSGSTLDWSSHNRKSVSLYDSSDFGASMCSFVADDDDDDLFPVTDEVKAQWANDSFDDQSA